MYCCIARWPVYVHKHPLGLRHWQGEGPNWQSVAWKALLLLLLGGKILLSYVNTYAPSMVTFQCVLEPNLFAAINKHCSQSKVMLASIRSAVVFLEVRMHLCIS